MKKAAVPSILFAVVLLAVGVTAQAQQPTKVPRIGFLVDGSPSTHSTRIEAFRHGLRELGYVEGKNINIEYRYAEGRSERLPELAEQLVRLKVDVLVGSSSRAARPAKNASATKAFKGIAFEFHAASNVIPPKIAKNGITGKACRIPA